MDTDFGWHLKVGQEIVQNGEVPHLNHYNYTLQNTNWVDHEWLANAIIYIVYNSFGYISLSILFALIALLTIILLNYHVCKNYLNQKSRPLMLMLLTIFGVSAMSPSLGIRVQEVGILFLIILYIILFQYSKTRNTKYLYFLPLLLFIWANLHGSFLLGIALMFAWIFIKTFEIILSKIKNKKSYYFLSVIDFSQVTTKKSIVVFIFFCIASILSTFLTPYGIELYSFLVGYSDTYYLTRISEWLPFHHIPIMYKHLFYSGLVVASLFSLIFLSFINPRYRSIIKLWDLAMIILFLFLSLKSRRHFLLFFISSYPFLILFLHTLFPPIKKTFKLFLKNSIILFYVIAVFILLNSYSFLKINFTNKPFERIEYGYPAKAIDFLQDNPQYDDSKIFNTYGWGGFMIWDYPERKLFIDGRLPQFEYDGHSMLEEYYDFFKEDKTDQMLSKHDIKLVLLRKSIPLKFNWFEKYFLDLNEENFNSKVNFLVEHLNESQRWSEIYNDDITYIYAKDNIE